ncbi:MAG TPA: hypothetical protein VG013_35095 [Gemmataceae bacterium]|jgi:hypothetical protein|nr:hypothetical protein [Gemmataceae bacterium]
MWTSLVRVVAIGLIGLGMAGHAAAQNDTTVLAPPVAITVNGVPLDAPTDGKGGLVYDNACPWVGDFDGNGKLALLIGHRDYRFPAPGMAKEGRPGRLRIYRNLADKGPPRLAEPTWFDDLVPTGRIPQG